jgi:hypothetical protein
MVRRNRSELSSKQSIALRQSDNLVCIAFSNEQTRTSIERNLSRSEKILRSDAGDVVRKECDTT